MTVGERVRNLHVRKTGFVESDFSTDRVWSSDAQMGVAGHESSLILHATAEERSGNISLLEAPESDPVMEATAGEKGILGSLEVPESDFSKNLAESTATVVFAVTRFSSNSSGVSSHACVSYLDALLSARARALAALTAARRVAPFAAVVGLGMHGNGSSVHGT